MNESTTQNTTASSLHQAFDVVHQRSRLSILAVLYELGELEFVELRRITKLRDGNLSRHLQVLEEAGLVGVEKTFSGKRPRTGLSLTAAGRTAFEDEIVILRSVVAGADAARKPKRSERRAAAPGVARRARGATPGGA